MQKFIVEMESDVKIYGSDVLIALEHRFTDLEFISVQTSGIKKVD